MTDTDGKKPAVTLFHPPELVKAPPVPVPGIKVDENVYVTMRDDTKLAVDVYRPAQDGAYPALLSLSPYNKDIQRKPPHWSHAIESGATSFYVPKGYVHVIAQGRGGGLSQGQWRWFDEKERTDGYDLIEWIAEQSWCTGNVGMIGDSYWSWSQYMAAAAQPSRLKCICQCDATTDLYRDACYQGGLYNAEFMNNWINYHTNMFAWPGPVEGKLPPMNLHYEIANHPCDGPWYWERSAWTKLDKIKTPVMSIVPQGGAMHMRGQLAGFTEIRAPKKLLVVPPTGFWSHLRYLTDRALNQQMLRWFDYWLKGIETGIMAEPQVAVFDSGTRAWRYEKEYPLARTHWTKFYLCSEGLDIGPPANEKPDRYKMPDSYAQLMAGKPPLAYSTLPLEESLTLWGPLSLTLYGSSTALDTAWFVKLADIQPDGTARPLSRGILKASFREVDPARSKPGQPFHPFLRQELLEPNKVYEFQIEMRPIFHTIKRGHRLQLQIASEDLQYNNPLRQTDVLLLPWPVENSVHHDAQHPSHLLLPVIPDAPEIAPVKAPVADINWPLAPGSTMPDTQGWPLVDD